MPDLITSGEWLYVAGASAGASGEIIARRNESMPDGTPVDVLIAIVMPQDDAPDNGAYLCAAANHFAALRELAEQVAALPEDVSDEAGVSALASVRDAAQQFCDAISQP